MKNLLLPATLALVAAVNVHAQSAETIANSPAPAFGQAPESIPGPFAVNALLFDNGSLVNSPGTGPGGSNESLLQDSTLGMGTFGFAHSPTGSFRVADDLVVPAGGWNVSTVTLYAYQTGSTTTSTITSVNMRIWDGVPGAVGSAVVWGDTTTNVLAGSTWSGIYRGLLSAPGATNRPIMANTVNVNTFLPAGTYWLDWQTGGSLASGPWAPAVTINGQTSTGNALQFDGTTWAALTDVGPQGLPFLVEGPDVPPVAAPTMSAAGMIVLALVLALGGLVMVRRYS